MELLILSPWWPFPPDNGSRLRAFHLMRELARQGHRLRLVAGVQDDARERIAAGIPSELSNLCAEIVPVPWVWYQKGETGHAGAVRALFSTVPRSILETPNPAMTEAIRKQIEKPTDAVLAMEIGMDAYIPSLPPQLPVIIDQVELSGAEHACRQAENGKQRLQARLSYAKSARYWRQRLTRYQLLTVVSDEEAASVRRIVGSGAEIVVVPNGVDVGAFPAIPSLHRVTAQMLYNGSLTYAPNHDAVDWFARDILPIVRQNVPQAHLMVTGRYRPDMVESLKQNPFITLTGFLPDLGPILATSEVAVVALRSGGGTRLKILECFAAHLPVVSTTIGAAGLGAEPGKHLLLADTADDFAGAVVRLLSDRETASYLSANARRLVDERFDWRAIALNLTEQIERVRARVGP